MYNLNEVQLAKGVLYVVIFFTFKVWPRFYWKVSASMISKRDHSL